MAINMQLSAALSRSRLLLRLRWRPREENTEADDLTNGRFSDFDPDQRIQFSLKDLDMSILITLVQTRGGEFDLRRSEAKVFFQQSSRRAGKKYDKSPW